MNYAILAAGEGSRLQQEGISCPKPLIPLNGVPILARLITLFSAAGASCIYIIINEQQKETADYLSKYVATVPIKIHIQSTPSSMHSFYELSQLTGDQDCCLSTVDTLFDPALFEAYIKEFQQNSEIDALMGVTSYIEDESPLYIQCLDNRTILNFLDRPEENCKYISGGIYCFRSSVFPILRKAVASGTQRMRNFQRQLIADGLLVKAYDLGKIIDIDHASDIIKASELLNSFNK